MDHRDLVRVSKKMSLALRHRPDRFGLALDRAGWVPVADLLAALRITRRQLDAVVAGNDKQRFAVERGPDGVDRVRANQGHSVPVELGLAPATPPDRLFHGTSDSVVPAIRVEGLRRGRRHHVHLSPDVETARRVGARRGGAVVVLTVDAAPMAENGYVFYRSANGVWLTDAVPPAYLSFP
ncbi:RNA 2'-phosphotransferase [Micromonospora narathiwatensis]|uniref:Probable RNA 2'-phosphotransferase n=1 Tax=Micromonospora narathiwatensis TaxID=299146 RepID=A0A1A8ZIA9_9ACTN|nr:RNA 2'-phosphotransferase [Micromonospora narathiwatensis]SBT43570.1 putative RNA 2'-phosphotransferase [Micromonospora narathiwatensis]